MIYETPRVVDYGDLNAMTAAVAIAGPEDGASKLDVDEHHS